MSLADSADRRIAGQLTDRVHIVGDQKSLGAHTRRSESRLGTGVTAAHHHYIK